MDLFNLAKLAKNPSKPQRQISIPVPQAIDRAFSSIDPNEEYVSHTVRNREGKKAPKEPTSLTTGNHAWYVGKLKIPTIRQRLNRLLGFSKKKSIYNRPFFQGSLQYLFEQLPEDQRAKMVVIPALSEIFNGPDDVADALSSDQQIEWIQNLSQKKFKKTDEAIEVVDAENLPEHQDLFQSLRRSIGSNGFPDLEQAFPDEEVELPSENFTSLPIAQILFKATRENIDDDSEPNKLLKMCQKAEPDQIKNADTANEREELKGYYAMTEVAIRITDILNGCFVHGGVGRQEYYDQVVINLIQGERGAYRDFESLKPIFKLLQGKRFETLHLSTERNVYQQQQERMAARFRLFFLTFFLSMAATGIFQGGRAYEKSQQKEKQQIADHIIQKKVGNLYFYFERFSISQSQNVEIFHKITRNVLKSIKERYLLNDEICSELKPFLQSFLLSKDLNLSHIYRDEKELIDAADEFIQSQKLFFVNRGIEVSKPYSHLHHLLPRFRALMNSKDNLEVNDDNGSNDRASHLYKKFEFLGKFNSGSPYSHEYQFYLFNNKHLVSWLKYKNYGSGVKYFSSKKAREGVAAFYRATHRFDALPLHIKHYRKIFDILYNRDPSGSDARLCQKQVVEPKLAPYYESIKFESSFRIFSYDVFRSKFYAQKGKRSADCFMAKTPTDKNYTAKRGYQALRQYLSDRGRNPDDSPLLKKKK